MGQIRRPVGPQFQNQPILSLLLTQEEQPKRILSTARVPKTKIPIIINSHARAIAQLTRTLALKRPYNLKKDNPSHADSSALDRVRLTRESLHLFLLHEQAEIGQLVGHQTEGHLTGLRELQL